MTRTDATLTTPMHPTYTASDSDVFAAEAAAIEQRRRRLARPDATTKDYVGLALSGGGIRSASFSLGVLQALDSKQCIDRIDYLSTVSGGGYIGCCLTACMTKSGGKVPFNEVGGFGDTGAVHHIRDFSNYLMPRGFRDLVTSFGLVGRGLAANAILLAPLFLLSTFVLLWNRPDVGSLATYGPVQRIADRAARDHHIPFIRGFPDTTVLIAVLVGLLAIWALWRSLVEAPAMDKGNEGKGAAPPVSAEFHGPFVHAWKILLAFTALIAWLEFQPIVLSAIAHSLCAGDACAKGFETRTWLSAAIDTWFTKMTLYLAPIGGIVAFLSRNLARVATPRAGQKASTLVKRVAARGLLWFAAIVVPSAIWYLYLRLTFALMPATTSEYVLLFVATIVFGFAGLLIDPNATSLHRLYRDRLSKAFLFDAEPKEQLGNRDLPENAPKLHQIAPEACPYPIVNAALNLEGSAFANRRGRNADFFEFTPLYVGSEATGWLDSGAMYERERKLDLGTAMAISGAAVSPNMGSATIKPLVPTLAFLNMRLGFWLQNPRYALDPLKGWRRILERRCFLLYKEAFSRIDETSRTVYVTDGGNIENLGVHALLKRRCKLIIVVDAEADPDMTFGAYLKLQRYARIDLGALLELPWQPIRDAASAFDAKITTTKEAPAPTPAGHHVAYGTIRYGETDEGFILYVKASLTGDESDYILDYKTRNPDFPHETTGDQFFGEEQLEVYRALGFHIMRYLLDERSQFEVTPLKPENGEPEETQDAGRQRVKKRIWPLLGLEPLHHGPQVPVDNGPRHDAGQHGDGGGDQQDRAVA